MEFNIQMQNLPRAARVCFTLWARTKDRDVALGWVSCQLVDYKHQLKTGLHGLSMWPDEEANPIGTTEGNPAANAMLLYVQYDEYPLPVVFPTEPLYPEAHWAAVMQGSTRQQQGQAPLEEDEQMREMQPLIAHDALCPVKGEDKKLLWDRRHDLMGIPKSLPKFLLSVAYDDRLAVQEMHYLVNLWSRFPTPVDALELLDAKFADALVRQYAVTYLEELSNEELGDYLLQLVQVLKYEPYHDSALSRFLLRRALRNRKIGHALFWYLRSEMHVPTISERFGLLLEAYLRGCGPHRTELKKQDDLLVITSAPPHFTSTNVSGLSEKNDRSSVQNQGNKGG